MFLIFTPDIKASKKQYNIWKWPLIFFIFAVNFQHNFCDVHGLMHEEELYITDWITISAATIFIMVIHRWYYDIFIYIKMKYVLSSAESFVIYHIRDSAEMKLIYNQRKKSIDASVLLQLLIIIHDKNISIIKNSWRIIQHIVKYVNIKTYFPS